MRFFEFLDQRLRTGNFQIISSLHFGPEPLLTKGFIDYFHDSRFSRPSPKISLSGVSVAGPVHAPVTTI
jgi:hypothetical protein